MIRVYKVRLYPTPMQEAILERWFVLASRVYNNALEQRISLWKTYRKSVSLFDQYNQLTKLRKENREYKDVSVLILRDALRRLDIGYKSFFRRIKSGENPGFPRFKSSKRWKSFEILNVSNYIHGCKVHIPNLGLIRGRNIPNISFSQKAIRVVKRASKWYAHLVVEIADAKHKKIIKTSIGVDVGISSFATLSNGESIQNPKYYKKYEDSVIEVQKIISRKKKKSNNRKKEVSRLCRIHERIFNLRHNFIHQISSMLVKSYDLICIEDLDIIHMAKSRIFSKSIYDASWSKFTKALTYKAENAGSQVIRVEPSFTSQNCSNCGRLVKKDISIRIHNCPFCRIVLDRDHNAAINILSRGRREIACIESSKLEALAEAGSSF